MAKFHSILTIILFSIGNSMVKPQSILSRMPEENVEHEGTWLQWPHHFTYGYQYRIDIEKSWIQMTRALKKSEKVYIIAYNYAEKRRIRKVLWRNYIGLGNIVFVIKQTDDAWVRDNGPMFVFDNNTNKIKVIDWGFNGWGLDAPFKKDNTVPVKVAK
jgi:agmatine deiminase